MAIGLTASVIPSEAKDVMAIAGDVPVEMARDPSLRSG
jgi:hypothetical protein